MINYVLLITSALVLSACSAHQGSPATLNAQDSQVEAGLLDITPMHGFDAWVDIPHEHRHRFINKRVCDGSLEEILLIPKKRSSLQRAEEIRILESIYHPKLDAVIITVTDYESDILYIVAEPSATAADLLNLKSRTLPDPVSFTVKIVPACNNKSVRDEQVHLAKQFVKEKLNKTQQAHVGSIQALYDLNGVSIKISEEGYEAERLLHTEFGNMIHIGRGSHYIELEGSD